MHYVDSQSTLNYYPRIGPSSRGARRIKTGWYLTEVWCLLLANFVSSFWGIAGWRRHGSFRATWTAGTFLSQDEHIIKVFNINGTFL